MSDPADAHVRDFLDRFAMATVRGATEGVEGMLDEFKTLLADTTSTPVPGGNLVSYGQFTMFYPYIPLSTYSKDHPGGLVWCEEDQRCIPFQEWMDRFGQTIGGGEPAYRARIEREIDD